MKSYEYNYETVAEAAGKTVGALRVDISRKRVDPSDLKSVAAYVAAAILRGEVCQKMK